MNIIVKIKYAWLYIEIVKLYFKFDRLCNNIFINVKSISLNPLPLIKFHSYNKHFFHCELLSHHLSFKYKMFKANVYIFLYRSKRKKKINFFY